MTYVEALERLFALRRFGVRPGLETTRRLLSSLGHPETAFSVIHVAGTNGKGSTAAFAESLLRAAGVRTGLYTSPHLSRFTERVRVDGVEISAATAAALLDEVFAIAGEATFFEVVTAMALLAFARAGVKVAVLECGLGGRFDSTNVITAPLSTVVTGIAADHLDVLGPTLADVAREKAGIWKPGVPAVMACDDPAARLVLRSTATVVGAPISEWGVDLSLDEAGDYVGPGGPLGRLTVGLRGAHQRRNAGLALAAVSLAADRGGFLISDENRRTGLRDVRWPARLELLAPDVLVDAAHNAEGATSLAVELPAIAAGRPITLVVGVVADKDARAILAPLLPLAARIVCTTPPSPRALSAGDLAALCQGETVSDPTEALATARDGRSLVVGCGSIFLVGELRRILLGEPSDPLAVQDPAARATIA